MSITRPALVAAAARAIAALTDEQRDALGHNHILDPDRSLPRWDGAREPAEIIAAAGSPLGVVAVGLGALLERGEPVETRAIGRPTVVAGDLRCARDLSITAPLVVLGDVVCSGVIADCGPDSTVAICGDCRCRGLVTSGDFTVLGDLDAGQVIHGVYNDNSLIVAGATRARFVDCDDHDISLYGAVEVEHFFELGRPDQQAASDASAFLVDQVLDLELWEIDWDTLFDRVRGGEPIFRDTPRPPIAPEPDEPTESELAGIDIDAIIAGTKRRLSRRQIAYADNTTGELWFIDLGAARVTIYDGDYWSSKTGGKPGADRQGQPADQRVTLWRKRGDLFVEIERFAGEVFVHVGWNNGQMDSFPRSFDSADAAIVWVDHLRERWDRGFVEVTAEIPGRGALERELGYYESDKPKYLSLCVRDGILETSAGERYPASELEGLLARRRAAGWILKILEWKPFGRMG